MLNRSPDAKIFQTKGKKNDILPLQGVKIWSFSFKCFIIRDCFWRSHTKTVIKTSLRACLHGGAGPQVGEVTRFGEVTRLST